MTEQQEEHGVEAIGKLIEVLKPLDAKTRINVLQFIFKALDIALPGAGAAPAYTPPATGFTAHNPPDVDTRPSSTPSAIDLRSLTEQKQPKTANQMVAIMAYYLATFAQERRDYITPDDIKKYFPQAGFELPTGPPSQTLVNAKNAGYLEVVATGQYRLNPVGHNLVTHRLPTSENNSGKGARRRHSKKPKKVTKKVRK